MTPATFLGGAMTSIGMRHHVGARSSALAVTHTKLIALGFISSVLYAILDWMAGSSYDGYSFYSQTISELGAIGAPKPGWLAPMFFLYCVLMVLFAAGVIMEGGRRNRSLRNVGVMLLVYMFVGSGTSIFPIHVRGTATLAQEMPHIITGLLATTVMLVTIGIGSGTLSRGFRIFSWLMFASIIVFGLLTVPSGMRLAAGEPTPGMGVLERLAYYSMLAWVAGLSIALLGRRGERTFSHQDRRDERAR